VESRIKNPVRLSSALLPTKPTSTMAYPSADLPRPEWHGTRIKRGYCDVCVRRADNVAQLWAALGESELSMVIIDNSASLLTLPIIDSVWSSHRNRQELLKDDSIFMSLSDSPEGIIWRRNVLDQIRQHEKFDPVSLMAFSIQTSPSMIAFGIMSSGGDDDSYSYDEIEEMLLRRFSRLEDVEVELRATLGDILQFDFDLDPTIYRQTSPSFGARQDGGSQSSP
jgi:hypothetical protein